MQLMSACRYAQVGVVDVGGVLLTGAWYHHAVAIGTVESEVVLWPFE